MPDKLLYPSYGIPKSSLEEITVSTSDVISGKKFLGNDGEIHTGSLSFSGNANVSQVLSGQTFYTNSITKQTGNMTNRGAWGTTINPGGRVTIPAGYHNGGGVVYANGSYRIPWEQGITTGYTYDPSRFVSVPNHPEVKVRVDAGSYLWLTVDSGVIHISHQVYGCIWVDGWREAFGSEENRWDGDIPLNG